MGRRQIAKKIQAGEYKITKHAYEQMIARDIYIRQIYEAIANGRVVKKWEENGVTKLAIVGQRFNGDYIKVVVKDLPIPKVITVCYPYEDF